MREQNQQLTSGLSPGREALFVRGCRPVDRRLFCFCKPFHARHVQEQRAPFDVCYLIVDRRFFEFCILRSANRCLVLTKSDARQWCLSRVADPRQAEPRHAPKTSCVHLRLGVQTKEQHRQLTEKKTKAQPEIDILDITKLHANADSPAETAQK